MRRLLAEANARGRRAAARAALREAVRIHPRDGNSAFAMLAVGERARGLAILDAMRTPAPSSSPLMDPRIEPFRDALHIGPSRAGSST